MSTVVHSMCVYDFCQRPQLFASARNGVFIMLGRIEERVRGWPESCYRTCPCGYYVVIGAVGACKRCDDNMDWSKYKYTTVNRSGSMINGSICGLCGSPSDVVLSVYRPTPPKQANNKCLSIVVLQNVFHIVPK